MASPEMHKVARTALNDILATSIRRRVEYGGMIYLQNGRFFATPARTQDEPARVDVGTDEPNLGCPEGTTPVAYYHTHPTYSVAGFKGDYANFSEGRDKQDSDSDADLPLARAKKIDAYLGTLDGSFLYFDYRLNKVLRLKGRLKNTE